MNASRQQKEILKNKFIHGFIIGLILPVLSFALIYVFDQSLISSKSVNITGNAHFMWTGFKTSTLFLMAFCANLIPTFFANRKYKDEFIRGIMIPTMIYCFIWFFYYKSSIL